MEKIIIRNFKGIKFAELDLNGKTIIKGYHESCKSSIANAVLWTLCGKDLENTPNFDPKPLDENNEVIDILTEVKITLDANNYVVKTIQSKMNKEGRVTGNDIRYYFNTSIEQKAGDYDKFIEGYFGLDLKTLYLMLNPYFFHNGLDSKDRRKVLIEMAGEVTFEDVLKALKDTKADEYLKSVKGQDFYKLASYLTTQRNKAQDDIQSSLLIINEWRNQISKKDFSELKDQRNFFLDKIAQLTAAKKVMLGKADTTKKDAAKKELDNLKTLLQEKKFELQTLELEEKTMKSDVPDVDKLNREVNELNAKAEILLKADIEYQEFKISKLNDELKSLRENASNIKSKIFDDESCSYCHQKLPKDKLEELKEAFNRSKDYEFSLLKAKGERTKKEIENQNLILGKLKKEQKEELNKIQEEIHSLNTEIALGVKMFKNIDAPLTVISIKVDELKKRINELSFKIDSFIIPEPEVINTKDIDEEIAKYNELINDVNKELDEEILSIAAQAKIDEYQDKVRMLQIEVLELTKKRDWVNEFNRVEIEMIESNVSRFFKDVRFKLFEEKFNGGEPKQVCEAMIDGITYNNLNTAKQIRVASEIADAMNKVYDKNILTIIDKRESGLDVTPENDYLLLQVAEIDKRNCNHFVDSLYGDKYLLIEKN